MAENNKDNLFEQYGFSSDESKSSAPDFGGFMSGTPVHFEEEEAVEEMVGEEYIAPAGAPVEETDPELNYMENMQNMFKSLSEDTTEEPVEEAPAEAVADPEPEFSSYVLGKEGEDPVKSQEDLLSSETRPFRSAPTDEVPSEELQAEEKGAAAEPGTAGSEQQMSTPKKPVEKGEEYWSFVDSLLDNFDDTRAHAPRPRTPVEHVERAPRVTAEEAAAAVAAATAEIEPAPVVTTRDSEASAEEAKSSGEAPAAGGYFLPRTKGGQGSSARRGFSLHEPEETVLPTILPEEPVVEEPVVEEAPVVEEPVVEAPVVEAPVEEPALPDFEEPEAENQYFKKPAAPVEEAPVLEEEPVLEETPAVDDAVVIEEAPVEEPAEEAPLSRAERKAQKKAEKQAAKEAKEAEKRAAREAKEAEKQAAAEAKAAAKEAKAAHPWEDPAENISLEEALEGKKDASADTPVIHEEKATLGAAPAAAAVADFDENARNAEFDATYEEPKKAGGALRVIRNIVVTLAALAIVACIAILGYNLVQQKLNARQLTQASTLLAEGEQAKDLKAVQKKYPDIAFPEDMQAKFGELYAQNQDLVGWINVPGSTLSYPVVQTKDDQYYQNHNFTKASSTLGTPFLSCKNDAKDLDLNNVVYGQASDKEPAMFSALEAYRDKAYFVKHPVLEYSTLYEDYTFKVYAVFVTNAAPEQDNGYVFDYTVPNLGTVESFAGYVDQLNERRLYDTGVDIESTDKLLTLSTSTDDFEHARLVVVGRLLREDESKGIDKTLVKTNKSPRYPQAYYDAAGKTNPYADADNWIPTIS